MFLIIDLKDHENKSHKVIQLELQAQTTIKALKDEIHLTLEMEPRFQEISDRNGRRIDLLVGSLEEAGIKDVEILVLKHSMMANWGEFKANFEWAQEALKLEKTSEVEEAVDHALDHLRPLVRAKFLAAYPSFGEVCQKFKIEFPRYVDQEFKVA